MSDKEILERIKSVIDNNKIAIFMKGEQNAPRCGFSAAAVQVLQSYQKPFEAMDVLTDPQIRAVLSAYSGWPTIPQIFIDGKFIGGCDILTEMHQEGELAPLIQAAFEE
jgi:monothiol glutaredoxin